MRGLSFIVKYTLRFCAYIFKHLGLNGLLLLILILVLPGSLYYTTMTKDNYKHSSQYTLSAVSDVEEVKEQDVPASVKEYDETYYMVTLELSNPYSHELVRLPSLDANQDDHYLHFTPYDYYTDIKDYNTVEVYTCVPAKTSVKVPYYFSSDDIAGTTITVTPLLQNEKTEDNTLTFMVPD